VQFAVRFDRHGGELSTASGYDRSEGLYIRDANSWRRAVADMTSRLICSLPEMVARMQLMCSWE